MPCVLMHIVAESIERAPTWFEGLGMGRTGMACIAACVRVQAAFGDALKGVEQVEAVSTSATAAAVDAHLDMLRPAITSYGASVQVRHVNCATGSFTT